MCMHVPVVLVQCKRMMISLFTLTLTLTLTLVQVWIYATNGKENPLEWERIHVLDEHDGYISCLDWSAGKTACV
jgi:hypothetical protein